MKKLTKIIATIGPSSDSEEMIEKLIKAGVNIFRFNFKHNTIEWHDERIKRVNTVAKRLGISVGTLIDLQGPEIRIQMPGEQIDIQKGDFLLFGQEALEGKEKGFSMSHPGVIQHLTEGQRLVADDGAFTFSFTRKDGKAYLKSENSGVLKRRKSLNIPGADFPFPVLVDRDLEGLKLAERNEVDYVALSFVRSVEDLRIVKKEMKKYGFKAKVVAKIETQKALNELDDIIEESDAIMIARGDLGVELPIEQVPYFQKVMIKKCIEKRTPVITATQMIQSMMTNPYPTRAEVSDIANACYDLTDAVMLSGETASGDYPLEAVELMARTAQYNELKFHYDIRSKFQFTSYKSSAIMAEAAYNIYLNFRDLKQQLSGFLVFTHSGKTAQLLSHYRPLVPIYSFAPTKEICDLLTLHFGVYPFKHEIEKEHDVTKNEVLNAMKILEERGLIKKGETLITLHGDKWGVEGGTSTVKIVTA